MATFHPHFRLANHMDTHEVEWPVSSIKELLEFGRKEYGSRFEEELKSATILVNGARHRLSSGSKYPARGHG